MPSSDHQSDSIAGSQPSQRELYEKALALKEQNSSLDFTIWYEPELKAHGVRFSNAYLLELEEQGRFPRRVSLGDRRRGWVASEVIAYIKRRIEERDQAAEKRRQLTRPGCEANKRAA